MEGLDVQVPGHSAAYRLVKSSSGAHIGFAFIRKDQAVEGLDSSCTLKLGHLDSSGTRVGSKEGNAVPPLTHIDLKDCDLQLPDTSSSSSVQVLLSDQSTMNSEPQAVTTDHTVDTSMPIILDSNIDVKVDVKTRIKTMAQEMLRSLKEVKEPPQTPVSKPARGWLGRGVPGGTRPNNNIFQEFIIDSSDIDPNRLNNNGTLNKNRRVECKLCSKVLIKPNFGTHMKKVHLPDEKCSFCGEEFPASTISSHKRKCFGVEGGDREEGRISGRFQKRRLVFSATAVTDAEPTLTSLATQGPVSGGSGAVTEGLGALTKESEDVTWGSEAGLGGSGETEAVPGGAGAVPVGAGAGAVQGGTEVVPEDAGAVPEGAGAVPGGAGAVTGRAGAEAVPGGPEAVPEDAGAVPGGAVAVSGGTGAVTGDPGTVPGGAGDVPEGAGAVPGGTGAIIGGEEAVPGVKRMVSGEAGAVLGGARAVPRDSKDGHETQIVGITMKVGSKSFKVMMPKKKPVRKAMKKIAARLGKEVDVLSFTVEGGSRLQGQEVMEGLEGKVIVVTDD